MNNSPLVQKLIWPFRFFWIDPRYASLDFQATRRPAGLVLIVCLAAVIGTWNSSVGWAAEAQFPWQQDFARVIPGGELEYAPQPFVFTAGFSVRYIDFEGGDDAAEGSREAPWRHHPWDPRAEGRSQAAAQEVHTYVFKGGVDYRGQFILPDSAGGTRENPIRLTRDPTWGDGPAVISGAEAITGWRKQAHVSMPHGETVWMAETDFLPRNLWMVGAGEEPVRLLLARWPNWRESDPNDLLSEWPTWDQPEWWKDRNKTSLEGVSKHVGIAASLPRPLENLVGGTVWSEWGIVMGSPYPAQIEAVDTEKDGIVFRGPWTYQALEKIITNNRYHLEDLPQLLDEPGEFWVEKTGESSAKVYLRLPGDKDPNTTTIEGARHYNFFEGKKVGVIHWSGLTFRFGNVGWDYNHPRWGRPNLMVAAININGSAEEIHVTNNTFEHLPMVARIHVGSAGDRIGLVNIRDNVMRHIDQGAVMLQNHTGGGESGMGHLGHVDFLRNNLKFIGMRILSGEHGHAVDIRFPETSHTAGNFLHRIGGWGLAVFGGKPSGDAFAGLEAPLSRHLMHHNRVEDVLLKSNDWGGIETWQGGSFYVFNNIVINAIGFKNWIHARGNKDTPGSFGHAYYLDGSFKNYIFNNIGLGRNNLIGTKSVNLTAIQNILSFENWFFHNSFHRFVVATRQQAPEAGRFRYLGNAFSDVTQMLYRHADPKDGKPDPNATHYTQGGGFDYKTLAYGANVIHALTGDVGTFEETGVVYSEPLPFSEALQKVNAQSDASVTEVAEQAFIDADRMDWRPASGMDGQSGARVFVPWALARTVGEWAFTRNHANPNEVIDEHWFMTATYADRSNYKDQPHYPLLGNKITAENSIEGTLEDWTKGALRLDGKGQFLRIAHSTLPVRSDGSEASPIAETRMVDLPFGDATVPLVAQVGGEIVVEVRLNDGIDPAQLNLHLHWMRPNAWGGFAEVGTKPEPLGENRYRLTVPAKPRNDLAAFHVLLFLSPDGQWGNKTQDAQIRIERTTGVQVADAPPRSVDVSDTSLLIEFVFRTQDEAGLLVQKMHKRSGYDLRLSEGKVLFAVGDGHDTAEIATPLPINDGQWQHLVAELDRDPAAPVLRIYLGGRLLAEKALPKNLGSLANPSDFYVGGKPGTGSEEHFSGDLDFLRVALSSLAESKTSIEELHAWQFAGPQLRDFTGRDRSQSSPPGAIVR